MKALTIRQPYASLVMIGAKPYEFRTWSTRYRGPLAIHAGAELHSQSFPQFNKSKKALNSHGYLNPRQMPRGAVLGVVEVVDCISCRRLPTSAPELIHCGVYDGDMFALVLERPQLFDEPIPARGLQGFWEWISIEQ